MSGRKQVVAQFFCWDFGIFGIWLVACAEFCHRFPVQPNRDREAPLLPPHRAYGSRTRRFEALNVRRDAKVGRPKLASPSSVAEPWRRRPACRSTPPPCSAQSNGSNSGSPVSIFDRSRGGFRPSDLTLELARRAETIETQLAETLELVTENSSDPAGLLRLTTTDTILQGLLLPLLADFSTRYSSLQLELVTTNQLASLRRREADLAIRATLYPPGIWSARILAASKPRSSRAIPLLRARAQDFALETAHWIAPDDSLAEHPSVKWRANRYPRVAPRYRCNIFFRSQIRSSRGWVSA